MFRKFAQHPSTASKREECCNSGEEGPEFAGILRYGKECSGEAVEANFESHSATLKTQTEDQCRWQESSKEGHQEGCKKSR
jgi:hypothetical protein